MRIRCAIVVLGVGLVAACSSGNPDKPDGGTAGNGAGGTGGNGTGGTCAADPVLAVFANRCSNAGCHVSGGQFPELTAAGMANWMGQNSKLVTSEPLVVPGNPDGSWLYRKVNGTQGANGGALMPLGAAMPTSDAQVIHDWIADGASTECNGGGGAGGGPAVPVNPNTLDQEKLFTCKDPSAPLSSVARIRRIDQTEWTHGIGAPNGPSSM